MTKTIEISYQDWEKIKDKVTPIGSYDINDLKDFVGKNLFIQTATFHYTGTIKKIIGKLIQLENAVWQAYQPRLSDFLQNGALNEIEPVGDCWIHFDWIVAITPYKHNILMVQK